MPGSKTVYSYDAASGVYVGESLAYESPLEPGTYLIPAHATEEAPPTVTSGQEAVFASGAWTVQAIPTPPAPPEPTPPAPTFSASALDAAIHTDPNITDDQLIALDGDGRAVLLQTAMPVAALTGDWNRVQRLYNSLKATPPSPCTTATIQAFGQHAVDAHATLTV